MSDDLAELNQQALSILMKEVCALQDRLTAIEAELAVMRGTLSASRWSGDSAPMTIEPADERREPPA